jgi:hypothetical protein
MNVEEIQKKVEELKTEMRALGRKRDLVIKNTKYKTDEAFRNAKKQKSLQYYHNVVKPTRTQKCEKDTPNNIEFKCSYSE